MKWLRQSSNEYCKDRAIEAIRDGEFIKATKCLLVLLERKESGTPKDQTGKAT